MALIISAYVEGASNNKALEFYALEDTNLENYTLVRNNGGGNSIVPEFSNDFDSLTGASTSMPILAGQYFYISHPSVTDTNLIATISAGVYDLKYDRLSNGDDATGFRLKTDANLVANVIDCVGDWGADPGYGWTINGVTDATKDNALVRVDDDSPNGGVWPLPNGPVGSWTIYAKTNFSMFGTYTNSSVGGGEGGGGGDPHINPIRGNPYTLPKTEDTFLLVDNNVDYDRLIIKGKCWYLPKEQYQDSLNRASDRNTNKLNKLKDLFENGTFFKYIKIEYKNQEVIIDMDDLSLKKYNGVTNLYGGSLPNNDKQGFKYGDMFIVNGITGSNKGLYTGTSTKTLHDTAYRTIMRTIEINTLDNKLTIEVARDRKNIARRNSIKVYTSGTLNNFNGCLIKKDIKIVNF